MSPHPRGSWESGGCFPWISSPIARIVLNATGDTSKREPTPRSRKRAEDNPSSIEAAVGRGDSTYRKRGYGSAGFAGPDSDRTPVDSGRAVSISFTPPVSARAIKISCQPSSVFWDALNALGEQMRRRRYLYQMEGKRVEEFVCDDHGVLFGARGDLVNRVIPLELAPILLGARRKLGFLKSTHCGARLDQMDTGEPVFSKLGSDLMGVEQPSSNAE